MRVRLPVQNYIPHENGVSPNRNHIAETPEILRKFGDITEFGVTTFIEPNRHNGIPQIWENHSPGKDPSCAGGGRSPRKPKIKYRTLPWDSQIWDHFWMKNYDSAVTLNQSI